MKRRALLGAAGLSLIFVIVLVSPALAAFRGSDMYSNLMPGSGAGLVDRYPISSYALDSHVDNGVIGTSNISASLAQFFSWLFFFIGVVAMRVMIAIFEWASSANFITGENGVLGPVGVVSKQYYNDLVVPFLSTVIVLFGVWLAYKAAKREVGEAWSAIMRVVCMSVVAIAIIFHPADTIGRAFTFVGDLSESVITLGQGTQSASDTIFETFVYKPWVVIEFGGLRTCTSDKLDADGYPLAATASNPAKQCHSALSVGKDGHGDYARRFLRFAPSSAQRDAEYQALRDGKPPDGSVDVNQCPRGACTDDTLHDARAIRHQFDDIKIDRTDSPAVDMMQSGGAAQRLAFVVVVLVGMAGGILLLGLDLDRRDLRASGLAPARHDRPVHALGRCTPEHARLLHEVAQVDPAVPCRGLGLLHHAGGHAIHISRADGDRQREKRDWLVALLLHAASCVVPRRVLQAQGDH
jgi:hypothetical protein